MRSISIILLLILLISCNDTNDGAPEIQVPAQTSPPRDFTTTIKDALFVVGESGNNLHALKLTTGEELWKSGSALDAVAVAPSTDKIFSSVIIDGKYNLLAMDGNTGEVLWKLPVENIPTNVAPYVSADNSTIYLATNPVSGLGGKLYAIHAKDGSIIWDIDQEDDINYLVQEQNQVVIYALKNGKLIGADASSGKKIWIYDFKDNSGRFLGPVVFKGYVAVGYLNTYYAFQVSDGTLLWKFTLPNSYIISDPAFSEGSMNVIMKSDADPTSTIYSLNLVDGKTKWSSLLPDKSSYYEYVTPYISDDKIFCLSGTGYFSVFANTGQKIWELKSNLLLNVEPLVVNGIIYTSGYDGVDKGIYAFDASSGEQIWKQKIDQSFFPYLSATFKGKVYNSSLLGN